MRVRHPSQAPAPKEESGYQEAKGKKHQLEDSTAGGKAGALMPPF